MTCNLNYDIKVKIMTKVKTEMKTPNYDNQNYEIKYIIIMAQNRNYEMKS